MTKKSLIVATALALCLLVSAVTMAAPRSQPIDPQLIWWTVDGGGGGSSGGTFTVHGGAGQPDTNVQSGGEFRMTSGFWGAVASFAQRTGPISGVVFLDTNRNGTRDQGEPGFAGVTVTLVPVGGGEGRAAITAADGSYLFTEVAMDDYTLTALIPQGYTPTTETVIQVTFAQSQLQIADIGAAQATGAISGLVFLDINRNGTRDQGEQGIEGVTVDVAPAGGGEGQSVATAADGSYLFTELLPGDYTVTVVIPDEYTPTTTTVIQATVGDTTLQVADIGAARLLFNPSISK